jgi:hypothetical protein
LTAVRIVLARAIHVEAGAHSLHTIVIHCTGIIVITKLRIELGGTPSQPITGIICTRVRIIAKNRQANANPGRTVVSNRAGITVLALPFIQRHVFATALAHAAIVGALVTVVT